ncbi:TonB-dependent siderophore receptor [Riemerella anatipestifer]|uniref:TonB-dependent siderophore receptor n=1 Tax=Riemerella anatipestifer TaxID=34085 RepID=UPI001375049C|nr:TonB-dependent siderophore receptor [Riemerella anatipestifer]MDY3363942.1 TonB-dependent siderophore receptor [Riemerella anatipestifer]
MKKIIISISLVGGILSNAQTQKRDSIREKGIEGVVIKSKYYKNYTAKDVSGSLRLDTPLLDIPQNIQVITSDALSDQQVLGISDGVLRNISGAMRLEHWGDMYARVNMRGARAAAFINGVNVTSNWGPLAEDMSYVDRIEFMKGPAGFMISNGEPSGIYNIVTKKPMFSDNPKGQFTLTTGSFNLYRADADVNAKLSDKLAVRVNTMAQNRGSFRPHEFNDRYVINPSITYLLSDKTSLTAEYIFQKAKMSEVGSAYVFSKKGFAKYDRDKTLTDPGIDPTRIDEHYLNINLQSQLSDNWKLTSQVSYMRDDQMGSSIWPSAVTDDDKVVRRLTFWKGLNEMKFAQVFLNGTVRTGNVTHKVLTGLDMADKKYMADWSQGGNLDDATKPFDINNPVYGNISYPVYDHSKSLAQIGSKLGETYSSLYFQDEVGLLEDKLRLTFAGRYTDIKQNQYGAEKNAQRFTPRIGISATVLEGMTVYGLYDQSFLPQSGVLRNGGKVEPITGENIELGIKKDWFGGKWNSTLSIYKITKNNELISDPSNSPSERFSIVKGQGVAKGLEFDVKGELFKGMNAIINYAWTDNEVTQSNVPSLKVGNKVAGYAKHTFNTWLNYAFQDGILRGFGASLGFTFMGDRTTWSWSDNQGDAQLGDYRKWDAGIFWGNKNVKITLNAFNISDEYLYSGAYYGWGGYYYYQAEAPRNYRLSLSYKF